MRENNFAMLSEYDLQITTGGTVITPTPSPEKVQKFGEAVGEAVVEGVKALIDACSK